MGLLSYYYWAILMERDMISHLTDFNLPMGNLPFIDHHSDIKNKTTTTHSAWQIVYLSLRPITFYVPMTHPLPVEKRHP
jgi:hypothetical protein